MLNVTIVPAPRGLVGAHGRWGSALAHERSDDPAAPGASRHDQQQQAPQPPRRSPRLVRSAQTGSESAPEQSDTSSQQQQQQVSRSPSPQQGRSRQISVLGKRPTPGPDDLERASRCVFSVNMVSTAARICSWRKQLVPGHIASRAVSSRTNGPTDAGALLAQVSTA